MKTIVDLENMKLQSCPPFDTAYDFLIESLNDYYISKQNGIERIKNELNNWDKEAQLYISDILIKRISRDTKDFNKNYFLELFK